MNNLLNKNCVPCEGNVAPLAPEEIKNYLKELGNGWELVETKKITKQFKFKNFKKAMGFVNKVADTAEQENHHPDIKIHYNKVEIILWTYVARGLTENDFILAAKINALT